MVARGRGLLDIEITAERIDNIILKFSAVIRRECLGRAMLKREILKARGYLNCSFCLCGIQLTPFGEKVHYDQNISEALPRGG